MKIENKDGIKRDNMALKQVFIINSDLNMCKGKIAVQIANAELYYMEELLLYVEGESLENENLYNRFIKWREEGCNITKNIMLEAAEEEINKILFELAVENIEKFAVYDRGLLGTQTDSFSCIIVEPLEEDRCDKLFGHLKLL